ncbi:MAG: hypothetical protein H0V79_05430 [Actinobacteria bacterium]|nr:hypothetical protein [Actinomycetota bacterium]
MSGFDPEDIRDLNSRFGGIQLGHEFAAYDAVVERAWQAGGGDPGRFLEAIDLGELHEALMKASPDALQVTILAGRIVQLTRDGRLGPVSEQDR